ncbi:MAG: PEP-CTERM sorting domain-containing protein [Pirellulales bacterium]
MTFLRRLLCALSLASLAIWASSASANVLLNSSFENGTGADATDWSEIVGGPAGTVARTSGMATAGSFAAHMAFDHINHPAAGGAYFIEQNQGANTINNADNFDLTFDAKADSTDFTGLNMFYQLLWLDQDGSHGGGVKGETLKSLVDAGIGTSYKTFSLLNINAPDGADSFLLRFQVSAGAVSGIANGLWVDNASLSVVGAVPEPASIGLLAIGSLLTLARRRR